MTWGIAMVTGICHQSDGSAGFGSKVEAACGPSGVIVGSARLVEEHRRKPAKELMVHGVEMVNDAGRLCRMNPAA